MKRSICPDDAAALRGSVAVGWKSVLCWPCIHTLTAIPPRTMEDQHFVDFDFDFPLPPSLTR
eukprot:SAG25_NODE_1195_length_3647_cov_3.030722_5_plen_61_part_01